MDVTETKFKGESFKLNLKVTNEFIGVAEMIRGHQDLVFKSEIVKVRCCSDEDEDVCNIRIISEERFKILLKPNQRLIGTVALKKNVQNVFKFDFVDLVKYSGNENSKENIEKSCNSSQLSDDLFLSDSDEAEDNQGEEGSIEDVQKDLALSKVVDRNHDDECHMSFSSDEETSIRDVQKDVTKIVESTHYDECNISSFSSDLKSLHNNPEPVKLSNDDKCISDSVDDNMDEIDLLDTLSSLVEKEGKISEKRLAQKDREIEKYQSQLKDLYKKFNEEKSKVKEYKEKNVFITKSVAENESLITSLKHDKMELEENLQILKKKSKLENDSKSKLLEELRTEFTSVKESEEKLWKEVKELRILNTSFNDKLKTLKANEEDVIKNLRTELILIKESKELLLKEAVEQRILIQSLKAEKKKVEDFLINHNKCLDALESSLKQSEELFDSLQDGDKSDNVLGIKLKTDVCDHGDPESNNNNLDKSQLYQLFSIETKEEKASLKYNSNSSSSSCAPPKAPKITKISLTKDGAVLNWESQSNCAQFSVFMAVKFEETKPQVSRKVEDHTYATSTPLKLDFVKVFHGHQTQCLVSHSKLAFANKNVEKPVYIFRLSAENENGHSPTTQVKWIKCSDTTISKNVGVKRAGDLDSDDQEKKALKISK